MADDGFDVALNDVAQSQSELERVFAEIQTRGRKALIVVADVSNAGEVELMVSQTAEKLGQLNVMVANAGICAFGPFLTTSVEDWDKLFAVNARGVFLCYQYAAKQMIKQGSGGKIIGACSGSGQKGEPMLSAYGATKFAVRGLTQTAAIELGRHQITVNCYAPGGTDTPMIRELGRAAGGFDLVQSLEARSTPLGRFGEVGDVASVVSFLASDAANWVTGQTIAIDGGRGLCGTPYHGDTK